jgi:hypothetical protein
LKAKPLVLAVVLVAAFVSAPHAYAQKERGDSYLFTRGSNATEIVSRASSTVSSSAHDYGSGSGAPATTLDAPGEAPRIPTLLVSTNACSQRAGNPGGVGVSTSLRDAIGDCIRDLPAYRPPANGDRPRRPNIQGALWSALDEVRRLAPHPRLAIAPGRIGLTGLESYFWLAEPASPVTATASVPGLRVIAEAAPDHYLWRFEPGADLMTDHPGRPWTETRPGNIGHTYETKGRYDVSVEVVWRARWRIGSGAWRELGFFSTVDSRRYPVREIVPVLTQS